MAEPRLNLNGDFFQLKPDGKDTFAPKNLNDFSRVLSGDALRHNFTICLSVRNVEETITDELEIMFARFKRSIVRVVLIDNGSEDSTLERCVEFFERASVPLLSYQFKFDDDPCRRLGRFMPLADSYCAEGYELIFAEFHEPTPRYQAGSFCVVGTHEIKEEVALLVRSLRTFHNEPIFILCDKPTMDFVKPLGDKDVEFKLGASAKSLATLDKKFRKFVSVVNDFHRVDCIAAKMDAMDWALKEAGDTFFLDADIVVTSNLNDGFGTELMLSPHFHGQDEIVSAHKFGIFNAGYLWTNNATLPEIWREIYLNRSRFFEQEGMAVFSESFEVGTFSKFHNVGFWREPFFPKGGVRSWHVHMTDCLDEKANPGLRAKYMEHRARIKKELSSQGRNDLLAFLKKIT